MNDSTHNDFTHIPNPYIVGNPIKDQDMFFGREDDFAYTKSKIMGGKHGGLLVLCGARRSGKTSILFQIKGGRLGEEFIPVLIDMQAMTVQSDGDFLSKLAREIVLTIGDPALGGEDQFARGGSTDPFAAFEALIERMNASLKGRKLVLMFDEYEIIEGLIDKKSITTDILLILANWMEHKEGVFIIFTGSDRLQERNPKYWERFLGRALHRRISFLSKSDTLRLVNEPVKSSVQYDRTIPELIYELTAGQPFYTQVLCQSIVDHLNEDRKHTVSEDDIRQVVQEIIENPLPQMIFAWSSLNNLEKLSLSIMADLTKDETREMPAEQIIQFPVRENIGYRLDANKVNESLERLFHFDLLDKDEAGETYIFKMDLWRQWIRRMHSIWQVIDEIQSGEGGMGEGIAPVKKAHSNARVWGIVGFGIAAALSLVYLVLRQGGPESSSLLSSSAPRDSTTLTLQTTPSGGDVYLNGLPFGITPIEGKRVVAATTPLRIRMRGFKTFEDTLALEKNIPFERTIELEELTGGLEVTSTPGDADIFFNGSRTGFLTPHTFSGLSVNNPLEIELRRTGYTPWRSANVSIYADSSYTLSHVFSTVKHQLTVRSEPDKARIFVDGKDFGLTPGIIALDEGTCLLALRREGYLEFSERIRIPQPGNELDVTLTRAPPGTVTLKIYPFADLYIDGELIERSATNYPLVHAPGTVRIELRHATYKTIEDAVTVVSGQQTTREYNMETGAIK
jgi:AAA+ ATPase superfamily predicted ATPase